VRGAYEHAVCLVEDEEADGGERDAARSEEVDESAGRGDEDVDALGHVSELLAFVCSAVDDRDACA